MTCVSNAHARVMHNTGSNPQGENSKVGSSNQGPLSWALRAENKDHQSMQASRVLAHTVEPPEE